MPNPPTLSDADKGLLVDADDFAGYTEGCANDRLHNLEHYRRRHDLKVEETIEWRSAQMIRRLASRLRAVLEGGQEDRGLLESFAECFGKGLYKPYKDHACIECDPTATGYPVTQGFRCCYHQLLARQSTPGEGKEDST